MILEQGTKVLIAHRRLFVRDQTRFFTGVVEGYEDGIARVTGHSWTHDGLRGTVERKADARTKIVSLSSGNALVYQLPSQLAMDTLHIEWSGTMLVLRDDADFVMDLSEGMARVTEGHGGQRSTRGRHDGAA